MAISSIRFDNFQNFSPKNVARTVDVLQDASTKERVSVISGEKVSRNASFAVSADGSAARNVMLEGENFSRAVGVTKDAEGYYNRSVSLTLPSGQQITRSTSIGKTVDEAGNTKVAVNRTVNGLAGVRTFVGDITSTDVTGTFTYAKGDTTKTYAIDRERKQTGVEPGPAEPLPISALPVEKPLDELA